VPVIADTAYPHLPAEPEPAELESFMPDAAEIAFVHQRTRQPGPCLALLVLLKTFQRLGYVVRLADVPTAIVEHVAAAAGLAGAVPEIAGYDDTTYRVHLAALVRGFVGVSGYNRAARGIAVRACIEAARTRDDLADIVNAGIEELLRQRRELPAFGTLLQLARTARAVVNRGYCRRITAAMPPAARERLAALLAVPTGATRSGWDRVKTDPPRPSPQRMREHLVHLAWIREQAITDEAFAGVPDRKLRQFAAEMFVRLTTRMHNRAREALEEHRARHAIAATRGGRDPGQVRGARGLCRQQLPATAEAFLRRPACGVPALPRARRPGLHLAGPRHRSGDRLPARPLQGPPPQAADHGESSASRRQRAAPVAQSVLRRREVVAAADRPHNARARRGPALLRNLPVHPGGQ
jgi:hypothetical protein